MSWDRKRRLYMSNVGTTATATSGATSYLLQEDGASRITLEDGSGFLLLEA